MRWHEGPGDWFPETGGDLVKCGKFVLQIGGVEAANREKIV
jgi:hypothetical protein